MSTPSAAGCASCQISPIYHSKKLKNGNEKWDYTISLAGNPNTGKSSVFNRLTGLKQHTGNWSGKTVAKNEGGFSFANKKFKLVDLPGTYSLLSTSHDEEIARDFLLFGQPDVTVVVVDATRLERNLNLVLQVMEVTSKVVVCVNLIDEAVKKGIHIDTHKLSSILNVPVVKTAARSGRGMYELMEAIASMAESPERPINPLIDYGLDKMVVSFIEKVKKSLLKQHNPGWLALRIIEGDLTTINYLKNLTNNGTLEELLRDGEKIKNILGDAHHDKIAESLFTRAGDIAGKVVSKKNSVRLKNMDHMLDSLFLHKFWAFPIMLLLFAIMFWITVSGANAPSTWLYNLLIESFHPTLKAAAITIMPVWLAGLLIDGMYLTTAWVVSVMLPPMAIFFPMFTVLEDLGYLPRVAFNLDHIFKKAGAHGKQAMTMMMGFGCNAAGITATRIIDSPREKLIAIITNNFSLCNGRWPTQILIASLFIGGLVGAYWSGIISAIAVVGVAVLGIILTFIISGALSKTVLKGKPSTFNLELPSYRPPNFLQILYTSFIDRTLFVLWRALVFALPAGAAIWIISNINVDGLSIAAYMHNFFNPFGMLLGLNGIIIIAYIVAIPANEIVIPTILMLTVLLHGMPEAGQGAGVLFEMESTEDLMKIFSAGGWTLLTAVNLMLFSLIHNPCSTTIYTIYKETGSVKWTIFSALMPLVLGILVTFTVAQVWRMF
jgi:ferrous iron transport protein B